MRAWEPIGILAYGYPKNGKDTWIFRVSELAAMIRPTRYGPHTDTMVVLDALKNSEVKHFAKQLKLLITDPDFHTVERGEVKPLVWPRRLLVCSEEDVTKWEWPIGLRDRFLLVRFYEDCSFRLQAWEDTAVGGSFVEKTTEEIAHCLDFKILDVKDMELAELELPDLPELETE